MKLHQIKAALQEPMLIRPSSHSSIWQMLVDHEILSKAEFQAKREGVDFCGEAVDLEQMEIVDGVARIPIAGPMGYKLGKFEKGAGAVDVGDIMEELDRADSDPEVKGILLDFDTPGGMVSGTPELADHIAAVKKPCFAFSGGMMASAGYWAGSAADRIYGTRSADFGSVGVYNMLLDSTKALEQRGIKVEVIRSDELKGIGIPGTSISEEQRAFLQSRVDAIAGEFIQHVQNMRGCEIDPADLRGQVFMGIDAMKRGFIDEIVPDVETVMDLLR